MEDFKTVVTRSVCIFDT